MSLLDLQNEYKEVKKSLQSIQNEISSLLSKEEILKEKCRKLENEIDSQQSAALSNDARWKCETYSWSSKLQKTFFNIFKMENFRLKQLEVMNATLSGRDVFLVMPTGGGKSLCYQLPAIISPGLTLVVSPLVSLMEDQCLNIDQFGIEAAYLCADTAKERSSNILKSLGMPKINFKLLFVTPEKIAKSKRFMAQLEKCYKNCNLSRIAIDEAHCASQWGNDFRPDYKVLGILKRQYPNTPVLALTATATNKVISDTKKMLNIPQALVFKTPLNRPNLFYEVRHKGKDHDDVVKNMADTIKNSFPGESGIVYCFSRADCEKVSKCLNKKGIKSAFYHAYIPSHAKSAVHSSWRKDEIQVICATVAFGMGIDKPNVKFVIHHSMSKSLENYYQESGRAGRDGKPALCLLYFGFQDMFRQSCMVLTEQTGLDNLSKMIRYCYTTTRCRRKFLSSHFGDISSPIVCVNGCDICCEVQTWKDHDVTTHCRSLLDIVSRAEDKGDGNRITALKLIEAAAGRGPLKTKDVNLQGLPLIHVQRIICHMLLEGYLREDFHFTPYSTISYIVPGQSSPFLQNSDIHVRIPVSPLQPVKSYQHIFSNLAGRSSCGSFTNKSSKRTSNDDVDCHDLVSQKRRRLKSSLETVVIDDSD